MLHRFLPSPESLALSTIRTVLSIDMSLPALCVRDSGVSGRRAPNFEGICNATDAARSDHHGNLSRSPCSLAVLLKAPQVTHSHSMHRSDAYLRGREAGNWTSARLVRSLWALAVLFLPALLARLSTTHADSALTDAIQKIDNVEDLGVSRSLEAAGERDPHRLHGLRRRQLVVSEFDIDSDAFSAQREARAPKKTTTKRKKTTTKKRATTRRKTKTVGY